jgi:phosphate transport system protein
MDVIAYEKKADELHVKTYEMAEKAMEKDSARAKTWLNFVSISKQLERISDHAMNMAEDVIYLLTGEIVRHRVGEFIAKGGASGKNKKS